jgi:hypothetical protein
VIDMLRRESVSVGCVDGQRGGAVGVKVVVNRERPCKESG